MTEELDITSKVTEEEDSIPSSPQAYPEWKLAAPRSKDDILSAARLKAVCECIIKLTAPVVTVSQAKKDFRREK